MDILGRTRGDAQDRAEKIWSNCRRTLAPTVDGWRLSWLEGGRTESVCACPLISGVLCQVRAHADTYIKERAGRHAAVGFGLQYKNCWLQLRPSVRRAQRIVWRAAGSTAAAVATSYRANTAAVTYTAAARPATAAGISTAILLLLLILLLVLLPPPLLLLFLLLYYCCRCRCCCCY